MGLRPPMCRTKVLAGKHSANRLNILVNLQLLCAQYGEELGATITPIESPPTHGFPIPFYQSFAISAVWPEFQCQIMPPTIRTPFGVRAEIGGRKWYQSKCRPTFPFDFCAHYRHILRHLVTIHNAADRQINRAIGIGRLCYSIGGLRT